MQIKNKTIANKILMKLAKYLKVKGINGLAEHFKEDKNKFYAWSKRGKIADTGVILGKCPEISKAWLDTGEGEMFANPESYPKGLDKFRQTAAQTETISKEKELPYGVTTIVEGKRMSPKEERLLEILRASPEAASIVEMMGAMDSDTRKDVQLGVQKEKLLRDLLKEKSEREVA